MLENVLTNSTTLFQLSSGFQLSAKIVSRPNLQCSKVYYNIKLSVAISFMMNKNKSGPLRDTTFNWIKLWSFSNRAILNLTCQIWLYKFLCIFSCSIMLMLLNKGIVLESIKCFHIKKNTPSNNAIIDIIVSSWDNISDIMHHWMTSTKAILSRGNIKCLQMKVSNLYKWLLLIIKSY